MDKNDILTGNIFSALTALALPIMGTSFVHMAYHLVDMIWIGILGSDAVASIGVAGYFIAFSMALTRLIQVGTEVNVAQHVGAGKENHASAYAASSFRAALGMAIVYGLLLLVLKNQLIAFFHINNAVVESSASDYLSIMAFGMPFIFINPIITCIYNGSGSSRDPFKVNSMGMVANLVLDPLFIFGLNLGVRGAAMATVLSQLLVTFLLIKMLIKKSPFASFNIKAQWHFSQMKDIARLGFPVALQSGLFSVFSILLARIVASFGAEAIAAQKVGVQIESISYMTAYGFSIALSSFTGQNFGAGKPGRVRQGIIAAGIMMSIFGTVTSLLLYFFARNLFMIFIRDPETVVIGTRYIQILGFSQMFMCIEIALSGGFNGLRKTIPPAIISILFTGLRVPAAYFLARESLLGLEGVWWTITGSSWIKGTLILIMISLLVRSLPGKSPTILLAHERVK
jgi:putative MATE family efflux protein